MDLRTFVRESPIQIADGITSANEELVGKDACANPSNVWYYVDQTVGQTRRGLAAPSDTPSHRLIEMVDFDVVVRATEDREHGAGLSVGLGSLGLGAKGRRGSTDASESRIKFSIPMLYPSAFFAEKK